MTKVFKRQRAGISLIETLVAFLVLSLAGGAIIVLTIQVLATNNYAKLRNRATVIAEQSVEQVRNYYQVNRYSNLAGKGNATGNCYADGGLATALSACTPATYNYCSPLACSTVETFFRRQVRIINEGTRVKATIIIWWLERGVQKDVTIDAYFYNY